MPAPLMSKEELIDKLVYIFRDYGYDGATLSLLSKVTGLGRASLYHHFPHGKREMAATVLSYMNDWMEQLVLSPLRTERPPMERLCEMSHNLNKFYGSGEHLCLLAVFSLGESQKIFHNQIAKAFEVWICSLVRVLEDAGFNQDDARSRAEGAILQIQGALVLSRGLNDTTVFKRLLQRLPEQLLNR